MQRLILLLLVLILVIGIALTAYAPDTVSMVFLAIMELAVAIGSFGGILPAVRFNRGLKTGLKAIERSIDVQSESSWNVIRQSESLFHQSALDSIFQEYKDKAEAQQKSGQIIEDIEAYISEDVLAVRCWQTVVLQIPGTLTGLGILGTFIGLIIGIRGIGFSSVDAALSSVQTLLSGIQVAFYTSIAGVILSLMFNITYRMAWNILVRNLSLFLEEFHKNVIPTVPEQTRYRERKDVRQMFEYLEKMPKTANQGLTSSTNNELLGNEQTLMPQILQALKNGEFMFLVQPIYELFSRKIIGGEALVRWNHPKLGIISPAVFLPLLERNGSITKLDQYIWEQVFSTIRAWIDAGLRPVPISVNISKTDILAMSVDTFFEEMVKKYKIPPQNLNVEISESAYLSLPDAVQELENKLRGLGFQVVMDGFDGNFLTLSTIENISADILKLDIRKFGAEPSYQKLAEIFETAGKQNFNLSVEGIESMGQLTMLRKCGCIKGQGFYLSKPVYIDNFERMQANSTNQSLI